MGADVALMKLAPALLLCVAFHGCGGQGATSGDSQKAEAELREVFYGYYDALEARDWHAACERMAPESIARLRMSVAVLGEGKPPEGCSKLWEELFAGVGERLTRQ